MRSNRERRWPIVSLALAALAGLAPSLVVQSARAQSGTEPVRNPVAEVYVEGDGSEIEDAVARGVVRVGSAVDFVRAPRPPRLGGDRFARVDVKITAAEVSVTILFARGGRTTRSVSRASATAVEGEEVALVVESALESELDAIREKPVPPPPIPPVPTPPPPKNPEAPKPPPIVKTEGRPTTLAIFGGVLGGVGAFGEHDGPVVRIGGELGVASSGKFRPSVALRAFYTLPFRAGSPRASADVSVVNLRVMPAAEWIELSGLAFGAGLGLGADIVSVSPRSEVAAAKLEPVSVRVDPVVSPTVLARVAVAKNVTVSASFGLDVALSSRAWIVDDGGDRQRVFEPMRVRPVGLLGVDFALFGDDRAGRAEPVKP